jgi:hypothetical protein
MAVGTGIWTVAALVGFTVYRELKEAAGLKGEVSMDTSSHYIKGLFLVDTFRHDPLSASGQPLAAGRETSSETHFTALLSEKNVPSPPPGHKLHRFLTQPQP